MQHCVTYPKPNNLLVYTSVKDKVHLPNKSNGKGARTMKDLLLRSLARRSFLRLAVLGWLPSLIKILASRTTPTITPMSIRRNRIFLQVFMLAINFILLIIPLVCNKH